MTVKNRRFYWLKLPEQFFERKVMRYLRSLPQGEAIILIYLKMLCMSLGSDGWINVDRLCTTLDEEIAIALNEEVMITRLALTSLKNTGLIQMEAEYGDIFMTEFPQLVGSESAAAVRMRKKRHLESKSNEGVTLFTQCDADVQAGDTDVQKRDIEIEKEIEKELELEKDEERTYGVCKNIRITQEEYLDLKKRYKDADDLIDRMSRYLLSSGKSYQNHYQTLCLWGDREKRKEQQNWESYSCEQGVSY